MMIQERVKQNKNNFLVLMASILLLAGAPSLLFADEWDNHEAVYAQKFESQWNMINTPISKLALNADRINIMLGAYGEIDFKIIELKIQPYIEFRIEKQND